MVTPVEKITLELINMPAGYAGFERPRVSPKLHQNPRH
jgi:hypothetical protein